MAAEERAFALRMIPYGVFVVTAINPQSLEASAATVHWVTQTSFNPCLLAACVRSDTALLHLIRQTNRFALHMLGREDQEEAVVFARPGAKLSGSLSGNDATIAGWGCAWGRHGTLLLHNAVAVLECEVQAIFEAGDHYPVIAEVIDTHVRLPPDGRPDEMLLKQKELGKSVFYAG